MPVKTNNCGWLRDLATSFNGKNINLLYLATGSRATCNYQYDGGATLNKYKQHN